MGQVVRPQGAVLRLLDPHDTLAVRSAFALKGIAPGYAGGLVFGPATVVAGGEGGIWIGDNAIEQVDFLDNEGALVRVIRWRSAVDRAFGRERQDAFWSASRRHPSMRRNYPMPDSLPAFLSILAGGGRAWVKGVPSREDLAAHFNDPSRGVEWMVCEFATRRCGLVYTPDRFRPVIVGADHVIAVIKDEFDVQQVALHASGSGIE